MTHMDFSSITKGILSRISSTWWGVSGVLDVAFEIPSKSNIITAKGLDLTGLPYHGGSTLSSGALQGCKRELGPWQKSR